MGYAIEQKWIGLAKEGTRGIAVTPPTKFIAVAPDTEFEYKENPIEDDNVRGILEKFPPQAGIKDGNGKLANIDVQSDNIGEILYSLLGAVTNTTSTPTTGGYTHVFSRISSGNVIQLPSYTIAMQRGLSAKAYNLACVKALNLKGAVDGKLQADVDFLFQTEAAYTTPTTPVWASPVPFMFYQTNLKIATVANTFIKDWTLTIDNQSMAQRTMNQSQDVKDILAIGKMLISGSFNIYMEDETERTKFLANTASSLEIILTGSAIGSTGLSNSLDILIPEIHYTAYPFGNLDGLLGCAVAFNAFYNIATSKSLQITLCNTEASY
jgi:hypothetical protein